MASELPKIKNVDKLVRSEQLNDSHQRILIEETIEYKIIFAASQLEINSHPYGGYYCTLSGEFYKIELSKEGKDEEKSFEPPLKYSLIQVRVDTSDVQYILRDIYCYLQEEKKPEKDIPLRKIGFFRNL